MIFLQLLAVFVFFLFPGSDLFEKDHHDHDDAHNDQNPEHSQTHIGKIVYEIHRFKIHLYDHTFR